MKNWMFYKTDLLPYMRTAAGAMNNTQYLRMKHLITLILILLFHFFSFGQILYPNSEILEYYRVIEMKNNDIQDRLGIFPSIVSQYKKDSLAWNIWADQLQFNGIPDKSIKLMSFRFSNYYNSKYPKGYNDGAVWKGKGFTSVLQGGISGRYGILEFTFAPVVYYSQNVSYDLASQRGNNSPYNYQFTDRRIDWVQRYGDENFIEFDWGQTDVRMAYKNFTLGASTQNIVWGPAQRNPLILSSNAEGIPHVDLGTHTPIQTKIGSIEAKVYWGVLNESEYFDDNNDNNYRYWTGMSISYSPSFIPSLSIGFNRALYKRGEEFTAKDLYKTFWWFENKNETVGQNDEYDQIASATVRWVFKEVGFDTYLEFGKNDFGGSLFGSEPDHARGYTIGMSKYIDLNNTNVIKLTYEHCSVDKAKSGLYRGYNTWYTHHIVTQGYTNNGQVMGASVGPGATTDYIGTELFFKKGLIQLYGERVRFNDDYFIDNILNNDLHDFEWTIGSRLSIFVNGFLLSSECLLSLRKNMYYMAKNDQNNLQLGLSISKQLK
ncbi:capsule assembly Wzi family protein [Reichenbachiella agarivorans]|uniref:Capsule assembly Wzi family protein n=1 Tax=Reichenbachiella agarivorans TaxID=2979464 RepID=A0ABY6CLE7_9BACT|nr:capsule assembly Wzi family protein [Reichenbachiella agarivorans]UXP30910.1 capsule assembly Wzi family protein [Reichenbachiella agarivorans]